MKNTFAGEQSTQKRGKRPYIFIIIAAAAVLVFALCNIISITTEYSRGREIYTRLEAYTSLSGMAEPTEAPRPNEGAPPDDISVSGAAELSAVDFSALQAINPEIITWIDIPGAGISYPVVHGRDNEYYLSHSAERSANKSGAIFTDMANKADFSDQNTVIYGHNMKDGSMFAGLHQYENADFFAAHPLINIYLPDGGKNTYEIISAYVTKAESDTYSINFTDEDAFEAYKRAARERSAVETKTAANGNIITLSTCIQNEQDTRYVVVAAKK